MSGEYTPEPQHTDVPNPIADLVPEYWAGEPAPVVIENPLTGVLGDLSGFGGDQSWTHDEPAHDQPAHDQPPYAEPAHEEHSELPEGVSQEIADQAIGHGVDPAQVQTYDANLDGTPDYYYTENSEGYTTFSAFDENQDGRLEYVSNDTDGDGNFDYTSADTDGDGEIDSTFLYDNN